MLNSWFAPETFGARAAVLAVLLMIPFVKPVLDPIDLEPLSQKCEGDVCSIHSTCGPSSSVTISKLFGQTASERELARESLTSRGGT